jgi:Rrf2 family nitric oxide-sensitive transcriptional repressor
VRRSEADLEMVPCFGSQGACVISPECVLANALDEALRAFLATLDRYTLADLARPRVALARLLRIDEPTEPAPA